MGHAGQCSLVAVPRVQATVTPSQDSRLARVTGLTPGGSPHPHFLCGSLLKDLETMHSRSRPVTFAARCQLLNIVQRANTGLTLVASSQAGNVCHLPRTEGKSGMAAPREAEGERRRGSEVERSRSGRGMARPPRCGTWFMS